MARRPRQKRRRAQNPGPRPSEPHRENVPGALDHASGEVEKFEASLIAGAGGVPEDPTDEEELEEEAISAAPPPRGADRQAAAPTADQPATGRGVRRVWSFLKACWAELQRVQWPDRVQVGQATAVVLGFVVIAGAYLGLADAVAKRVIDFIL